MVEIYITRKASRLLSETGEEDTSRLNGIIRNIASGSIEGLRIWGCRDVFIYENEWGTRIVYRKGDGRIVVLSLQISGVSPAPRIKVSALILAAGRKQQNFEPPLSGMIQSLLNGGIDDLILVSANQSEEFKSSLADKPVKLVINPEANRGLSFSIRSGLKTVAPDSGAIFITLGNRPFITPALVNTMIRNYKQEKPPILVPTYACEPGHPVVFTPDLVPELMRLKGNTGGRNLLKHYQTKLRRLEVDDRGVIACLGG
ncbi:MAG: nucleotidyltransferase family protein [Dehalococcoidaceae bacterium]|nr:nucleotidyltransferase family protein [Dehalococcoidaceae bacterium]